MMYAASGINMTFVGADVVLGGGCLSSAARYLPRSSYYVIVISSLRVPSRSFATVLLQTRSRSSSRRKVPTAQNGIWVTTVTVTSNIGTKGCFKYFNSPSLKPGSLAQRNSFPR